MKTYEFIFADGTRMTGTGNDLAEALHDAYRKNGFLPFCDIVEKVSPDGEHEPTPVPVSRKRAQR